MVFAVPVPVAAARSVCGLVVGQGDLDCSQVTDCFLQAGCGPGIGSAPGPAPSARFGGLGAGQQETEGGQLRQGAVLTDVGVPRPLERFASLCDRRVAWCGTCPVSAPVGTRTGAARTRPTGRCRPRELANRGGPALPVTPFLASVNSKCDGRNRCGALGPRAERPNGA